MNALSSHSCVALYGDKLKCCPAKSQGNRSRSAKLTGEDFGLENTASIGQLILENAAEVF